ncbi:hypothetical protein ACJRPK_14200 [Aquimarina sp. 2-A2]|uniref:hypothetical protein n=1 Tax=Aquimarina sp. 2-A2 TaxID=3382644 RepID=UPI00387F3130
MAKEKFNWKGLFINDEDIQKEEPTKTTPKSRATSPNSFPETAKTVSKFPTDLPKTTLVSEHVLNTVIEMYESGFKSLNKPGYDFYEFFKAINAVGSNDAAVYKMAFTMAQGVDVGVTKESLLSQADFYIQEIEKVHKQYKTQGNSKKAKILNAQKSKRENLNKDIFELEKKLIEIQNQISTKRNELQTIETAIPEIVEIDQKIIANDKARAKISDAIVTVINGIKNNI